MYYPLSQIKTNLYTNGGEYVYSSTQENYIGFYWETSKKEFFTGRTPQDTPTEKLLPLVEYSKDLVPQGTNVYVSLNLEDIKTAPYINAKNIDYNEIILLPTYSPNIPTLQDYQVGEFRRYFCKKINEILYIEINKNTFDKLKTKSQDIAYQYYIPFDVPWNLTGSIVQTYLINKNIVELTMKRQKLPQFNKYLKEEYLKYYRYTA